MRISRCVVLLVAFAAAAAHSQQEVAPSVETGPLNIKPSQQQPCANAPEPVPLSDGTYARDSGVAIPRIVQPAAAVYPANAAADAVKGVTVLSLVVGADGIPVRIRPVHSHGAEFDDAAVDAVIQSKFEPGSVHGNPVPVRVMVRVSFAEDHSPALPTIVEPRHPYDTAPRPVRTADAIYSNEARRKKIQGTVTISLLVTAAGQPDDLEVTRSVGYGLDEKALEAVRKYEFRPAMKDCEPIATRITVDVSFRLY
jgi:TonB family protein